jgi:FkbM family methyltransferase
MAGNMKLIKARPGPMMVLTNDFYVGHAIEVYGEYCPAEWAALRQLVRPGMNVIEVGANMGSHSVDLARACAPGIFYAFEPQPRLFQIMAGNLALNEIGNALVYPDGCGEAEGEAVLPWIDYDKERANFGALSLAESGDGLRVRIRTIDSLGLEQCGLIKIDVEGFEPRVLRGAAETIRRCRPGLYVENDRGANQQEVIDLIAGHDYRLFWHTPYLFSPNNFRGETTNIYGHVLSVNMIGLPREKNIAVDLPEVDPANWTSPVKPI